LTRDCDFAVSVDNDQEAEDLIRALATSGYVAITLVEQEKTGRLATARLQLAADEGRFVDLLFASSGIEPEVVDQATVEPISRSVSLPVASVGHLMAIKLLARDDRRRPQDADDLSNLRDIATAADWDTAADAVALIMERGYARGRDLTGSLKLLRTKGAY
jgi:predicted nucleotidyltransferase